MTALNWSDMYEGKNTEDRIQETEYGRKKELPAHLFIRYRNYAERNSVDSFLNSDSCILYSPNKWWWNVWLI